jgi:hypothetical protein
MKASPPNASALQLLEQALLDASWRSDWDEHSKRFATSLTEALKGPLRSLGVGTSVAVAYTAARSAVALAPAAYHETWARVTLSLVIRESLRRAAPGGSEAVSEELGRVVLELSSAVERLGARSAADAARAHGEPLLAGAHDALARASEAVLATGAPASFTQTYFEQVRRSLPQLVSRDASTHGVLRAAVLKASQAAHRADAKGWARLPTWSKRALLRLAIAETAAAMVEGVPPALAQSAQGGSREGKDACMSMGRSACQVLACMASVEGWVWEAEHEAEAPEQPAVSKPQNTQVKVEKPMTMPKQPIVKTLQSDAVDAAWRTAASQFVKLTREPLVAVLQRHLGPDDEGMRAKIAAFLETDVGTSLLASMLSIGLAAMPNNTGDVPQRLSKELRIKAMTDMGDLVADVLMGPLRQVVSMYLQDMPATTPMAEPAELPPAAEQPELRAPGASRNVVPIANSDRDSIKS